MNAHQIKYMVDRFLGWKLPQGFSPDNGISYNSSCHHPGCPPMGTNLFSATEAHAMVQHMVEGLPAGSSERAWTLCGARGCDPKCVDLAIHFLPPKASDDRAYQLALHIQEQIESWMQEYEAEPVSATPST